MIKKYLSIIKQVTIASAVSVIIYVLTCWITSIYVLTHWITSAFMNEVAKTLYWIALVIYSVLLMGVFCLLLIRRIHVRNSVGEEKALKDFENGYWGIKKDYIFLFKREISTLIAFAFINGASWIMISIDKLIFSRRTVTAILLLYAPLNIVGITLPEWINGILGYLFGTIFCFAIYLLELVLFRKKWYMHWKQPRR